MTQHPMVDAGLRFLVKKNDPTTTSVAPPGYDMTPREFFKKYCICWVIDDQTKAMGKDGSLYEGPLPIISNMDRLWANLKVVQGPTGFYVIGEGESCFSTNLYQKIWF